MTSCITSAAALATTKSSNNASLTSTATNTNTSNTNPGLISPPNNSFGGNNSSASHHHQQQQPSNIFQQQYPQAICSLRNQSHHPNVAAHPQETTNSIYNGIFLVDGLGSGVRIDTNSRIMANSTPAAPPAAAMMPENNDSTNLHHVHHHQYGLPTIVHSPTRQSQQNQQIALPQMPNPLCIRIDSASSNTMSTMTAVPNPNVNNLSTTTDHIIENRFGGSVTCASQNQNSNASHIPNQVVPSSSVVSGMMVSQVENVSSSSDSYPTFSTASSTQITPNANAINSMPKYNRNSVTLSVPSPPIPSSSGFAISVPTVVTNPQGSSSSSTLIQQQQQSSNHCSPPTFSPSSSWNRFNSNSNGRPTPTTNRMTSPSTEMTRTNITVVPPNTTIAPISSPGSSSSNSSNSNNMSRVPSNIEATIRTLISTEAQTEDVPSLPSLIAPPPPPNRNNREQRKRERRERRRDRNHHYLSHSMSNSHGRPGTSGSHLNNNGLSSSSARHVYRNGRAANNDASTNQTPSSSANNSNDILMNTNENQRAVDGLNGHPVVPNNETNNNSSNNSIPDLLINSQLPPPYSTLPQNNERRLGCSNVPCSPSATAAMLGLPPLSPSSPLASNQQHQVSPHQHPMVPHVQMLGPPPHLGQPQFLGPPLPGQSVCHMSPTAAQPVRYHFTPTARTRRSLRAPRGVPYASEEEPKSCCGMSTSQAVSIRWFIIIIAIIGICCTVAGTALGAARSSGSQHLTLSLLMIGVGVVLLTVSAVAWRLTANESGTSCRAMLGFARSGSSRGDGGAEPNRRFVPRLAPSYGRPHHPYAAMMYPDFQYRPPPPSYNQSMQEYRLRLLLLERSNPTTIASAATLAAPSALSMVPPPPAYRPYNGTLRPCGNYRIEPDYSQPPSYRSRSSGVSGYEIPISNAPCLDPALSHPNHPSHHHQMMDSPLHSRDPSLLSYLSQQSIVADNVSIVSGSLNGTRHQHPNSQSVVTVMQAVSVGMDLGLDMTGLNFNHLSGCRVEEVHGDENKQFDCSPIHDDETPSLGDGKVVGEGEEKKVQKTGGSITTNNEKTGISKDGNLVRIVQTTNSSQVIGRDTVIVTLSGSPIQHNTCWDQSTLQLHQQQHQQHNITNTNLNNYNYQNPAQNFNHQHSNTSNNSHEHQQNSSTSGNNEVQILAHL